MFHRLPFLVCLLAATAVAQPRPLPVMPYDSLMEDRVSIDGMVDVEENEYPASLPNPTTGITVHWGFDDSLMYVALTSRGTGWMGVGFGSAAMNEANLVIGWYSDDSSGVVNHLGRGNNHAAVRDSMPLLEEAEVDFDEETGVMTLEFCYPLQWTGLSGAAIGGLLPDDTYDLILARNAKSVSLADRHGQRAALKFRLAPVPKPEPKPEPTPGGE